MKCKLRGRGIVGEKAKEKQKLSILWSRIKITHILIGLVIFLLGIFNGYLLPVKNGLEAYYIYTERGIVFVIVGEILVFTSLWVLSGLLSDRVKRLT